MKHIHVFVVCLHVWNFLHQSRYCPECLIQLFVQFLRSIDRNKWKKLWFVVVFQANRAVGCICLVCQRTPAAHACRSRSAELLRVTAAMACAVCGQTLPVVVKAQTISRSAGPLFLSPLFSAAYCTALAGRVKRGEGWGECEINGVEERGLIEEKPCNRCTAESYRGRKRWKWSRNLAKEKSKGQKQILLQLIPTGLMYSVSSNQLLIPPYYQEDAIDVAPFVTIFHRTLNQQYDVQMCFINQIDGYLNLYDI